MENKTKKKIIYLIAIFIAVIIVIFIFSPKEKPENKISLNNEIIPDPMPKPIEQVDCLKGGFSYKAKPGEKIAFEVVLDKSSAAGARLAPLPRGVSGNLEIIEPGLGQVALDIGKNTAPADYSLNIIIEEGMEDKPERLCQFNLVVY